MNKKENKLKEKTKGVWIPMEILQMETLTISEKIVYAYYLQLTENTQKHQAIATNEQIAETLGIPFFQFRDRVKPSLKKKGLITSNGIATKTIQKYPQNQYTENTDIPHPQNEDTKEETTDHRQSVDAKEETNNHPQNEDVHHRQNVDTHHRQSVDAPHRQSVDTKQEKKQELKTGKVITITTVTGERKNNFPKGSLTTYSDFEGYVSQLAEEGKTHEGILEDMFYNQPDLLQYGNQIPTILKKHTKSHRQSVDVPQQEERRNNLPY